MKRKLIGLVAAVAASLVMATGASAESAEPKYGGTLKYASHNVNPGLHAGQLKQRIPDFPEHRI